MMTDAERTAWLAERKSGIGSSDAPAVCGVSPWGSPYGIYLEKTGQLPAATETAAMRWGLLLEDAIAAAYEDATGQPLLKPDPPIARHPARPWQLATVDRVTRDGRIVELKTAGPFAAGEWGEPGTDQVPRHYLVQVHHQMLVADTDEADVAVLIGGSDFRIYTVRRSPALALRIHEIETDFWGRVQRREPPEIDWRHPTTPDLVRQLHGLDEGAEVELGLDVQDLAHAYREASDWLRAYEESRAVLRARMLHAMGDAARATLPDGTTLTRKRVTRREHVVSESTFVDFRIKQPKPAKEKAP